jgi:hypothetical protein
MIQRKPLWDNKYKKVLKRSFVEKDKAALYKEL